MAAATARVWVWVRVRDPSVRGHVPTENHLIGNLLQFAYFIAIKS